MLTHELLIRCEDGFEGTAKEVGEHLGIKDVRKMVQSVSKVLKYHGHRLNAVGMYYYYQVYEVYDLEDNLVYRGTGKELSEQLYCNSNVPTVYANKDLVLFGKYKIKKAEIKRVLQKYGK